MVIVWNPEIHLLFCTFPYYNDDGNALLLSPLYIC